MRVQFLLKNTGMYERLGIMTISSLRKSKGHDVKLNLTEESTEKKIVEHINLPVHSKNPLIILSNIKKIKEIILNNKINLNIPIVLFHGTNDKVVPLNTSRRIFKIFKKSKKKLIKIKNGDHSLSRKSDLKKICNELSYMIKDHAL